MERHRTAVLAVLVLVVLAGCGGAGDGGENANLGAGAPDAAETGTPRDAGSADPSNAANAQPGARQQRAVIFTGQVAVEVEDYDEARNNLTRTVRSLGGYTSDATEQVHQVENDSYTTGSITLRVPRANFTDAMTAAKSAGELLASNRKSSDVTDRLVDLEARLANYRAQRDRLRDLYQNASDTEAVLEVEERLSDVQAEIERSEATLQSLRSKVTYSTITVELEEPRPEAETERTPAEQWYDTGPTTAFLESVSGVVTVARATTVGLAYVLPYLLVFGVPVAAVGAVLWRRRPAA